LGISKVIINLTLRQSLSHWKERDCFVGLDVDFPNKCQYLLQYILQRHKIKIDVGDIILNPVFAILHVGYIPRILKVVDIEAAVDDGIQVDFTHL
jgi:hypothetical protein